MYEKELADKDILYLKQDEIENIKIVNINTNEVIATLSYVEGDLSIDTKKPYTNYVNCKNKKEEKEIENEIK